MSDIPRRSLSRTAKLVGLPLGHAGRAAVGLGRRVGGAPAEAIAAELQARTYHESQGKPVYVIRQVIEDVDGQH